MNKTSHTTLLLALFLLTGLLNQQFLCGKNLDWRESIYGFALGIKAYPAKGSISVGDTVWLEVSSPTTLQDVRTGRMIDYSGAANLGTAIGIADCTSKDRINSEGIQFFKFSLQKAILSVPYGIWAKNFSAFCPKRKTNAQYIPPTWIINPPDWYKIPG